MGKPKDKEGPKVVVKKLPPKLTPGEWRARTRDKLRQYEAIGFEILGKKSRVYGDF